jgi:hypothetical protein
MTRFPKPKRADRQAGKRVAREREILARGELRSDVLGRAQGRCESCGTLLASSGVVFDHWLGGSGRRRQRESLETCWALCVLCNWRRTTNLPTAEYWNDRFRIHCERYGYGYEPHLTKYDRLAAIAEAKAREGGRR